MNREEINRFMHAVDGFTELPIDSDVHEFTDHAHTTWIDGINWGERPNEWASVTLHRLANNEPGFATEGPVIDYEIDICLGPTAYRLSMCPHAAIALGTYLTVAGTAAVRDLARNAAFVSEQAAS